MSSFVSDLKRWLKQEILWKECSHEDGHYEAVLDGQRVFLRLNDFPDEPLYSVVRGDRKVDMEERPPNWRLV